MVRLSVLALILTAAPVTAFVPGRGQTSRVAPLRMATTAAPATVGTNVAGLMRTNGKLVESLNGVGDVSEMTRLRFAMAFPNQAEATANLKERIAWSEGKGKAIVDAAAEAYAKATEGGGWDNDVVRAMAPHANLINDYISPKNTLTLSTDDGDLVYVIRASCIEDKKMMDVVTVDQVTEFLLYVKEIHWLVSNSRSERTGRFCQVLFANDISGIRQVPDPRFSKALTESSKSYEKLYPSLAGTTMILNLPFVLNAFVGLFKPLFPKSVQERLKFKTAPVLKSLKELTPLSNNPTTKKAFVAEVKKLLDA